MHASKSRVDIPFGMGRSTSAPPRYRVVRVMAIRGVNQGLARRRCVASEQLPYRIDVGGPHRMLERAHERRAR